MSFYLLDTQLFMFLLKCFLFERLESLFFVQTPAGTFVPYRFSSWGVVQFNRVREKSWFSSFDIVFEVYLFDVLADRTLFEVFTLRLGSLSL